MGAAARPLRGLKPNPTTNQGWRSAILSAWLVWPLASASLCVKVRFRQKTCGDADFGCRWCVGIVGIGGGLALIKALLKLNRFGQIKSVTLPSNIANGGSHANQCNS